MKDRIDLTEHIEWRTARLPARDGVVVVDACPLCGVLVIDRDLHTEDHQKQAS